MLSRRSRRSRMVALNESPSEKEGKSSTSRVERRVPVMPSMKAPPKRKGNERRLYQLLHAVKPSMKAPPKRKGNPPSVSATSSKRMSLNESPSEKEGKS